MDIRYDRYSMILDGKREIIRSGALHYFRLPSQDLWRDRLYKLKAAGYNTVDLYFNWGFHSTKPGQYDFSGIRDVDALLRMTQELGLWVIARPGPYINAEVSGGGFPGWLIARKDVMLRNRDAQGAFQWSQPYMDAVREWYEQILPRIRKAPNVLMVQIENEYATQDMEPDTLQALYHLARELGITVPLMHNDMYIAGLFADVVDLYAFDHYPVTEFEADWRHAPELFGVIDDIEARLRPVCENRPLMVAELQAGWFANWQGVSYEHIQQRLGREHLSLVTKSLLGQGLTVFNHYKAVGGTNWGFLGSTDTYTSYDFGAPIAENGLNTERLYEAKAINLLLSSFDMAATERAVNYPFTFSQGAAPYVYAVRRHVTQLDTYWIFLRNLTAEPADFQMMVGGSRKLPIHLNPHEMLILPYRVTLNNGVVLARSNVEPLYQGDGTLIVKGDRPVELHLVIEASVPVDTRGGKATVSRQLDAIYAIQCPALAPNAFEEIHLGGTVVYILGQERADKCWVQEDGFVMIGLDARLYSPDSNNSYTLANPKDQVQVIAPHGNLTRELGFPQIDPNPLPKLRGWRVTHAAPELFLTDDFQPISPDGADFDSNGFYEGSAWYQWVPATRPQTITLKARHIWAVFIGGQLLGHGHYLSIQPGELDPPEVQLTLPPELWEQSRQKSLQIFVDGLGHPKGFHDDTQAAQGLLSLVADGVDVTQQVQISPGISSWRAPLKKLLGMLPDTAPIVRADVQFELELLDNFESPVGLYLGDLDSERINVYVNGQLVGRDWRQCQCQQLYYLPPGLLKTDYGAENRLELVLMNFDPYWSLEALPALLEKVSLQFYGVFTKVRL
jgi:hypothetical protein